MLITFAVCAALSQLSFFLLQVQLQLRHSSLRLHLQQSTFTHVLLTIFYKKTLLNDFSNI